MEKIKIKNKIKAKISVLDYLLKGSFYLLIFLMPLAFASFTYEKAEFNKQVVLWIFTGAIFVIWLFKILSERKILIKKSWVNFLSFVFILANFFALIFSKDRYFSFWGSTGRYCDSFLTLLCMVFLFLLLFNYSGLFSLKKIFASLFFAVFIAETVLIAMSAGAFKKISEFLNGGNILAAHKEGSAVFLAVVAGILLQKLFLSDSKKQKILILLFLAATLVSLAIFNYSFAWVILIVLGIVLLAVGLKNGLSKAYFSKSITAFAVILISFAFIFNLVKIPVRIKTRLISDKILSKSDSLDISIRSLKENFFFGSGQGGFSYVFSKFRPVKLNDSIFWQFRYNQAGNLFSEIIASSGFLGAASWVVLYLYCFNLVFSQNFFQKISDGKNDLAQIAVFGSLSFLLASFFYGSATLIIFSIWIFLAMSLMNVKSGILELQFSKKFLILGKIMAVLFCALFVRFFWVSAKKYGATVYYNDVLNKPTTSIEQEKSMKKVIELENKNSAYFISMAQIQLNKFAEEKQRDLLTGGNNFEEENIFVRNAMENSDKAVQVSPNSARAWEIRGTAYETFNNLEESEESFKKALDLDPNSPFLHLELAKVFAMDGKIDLAREHINKAIILKPNLSESYFNMGRLEFNSGNFDLAINFLEKALEINSDHLNSLFVLALSYENKNEKEKAKSLYEKILSIDPDNEGIKKAIERLSLDTEKK